MISVSKNSIIQSNPVSRHVLSTNRTGFLRFNNRFRYNSPVMFSLTILFTVPFRLFHILCKFHLLLLLHILPLFLLLFLCINKQEIYKLSYRRMIGEEDKKVYLKKDTNGLKVDLRPLLSDFQKIGGKSRGTEQCLRKPWRLRSRRH